VNRPLLFLTVFIFPPFAVTNAAKPFCKRAGRHAEDGSLTLERFPEMEDMAIIKQIAKVKGLGRWTAEIFLVLAMARPDVFPGEDLSLQKALKQFYGLAKNPKTRTDENALTASWRPWRSLAAWHLWRYLPGKR
jgi:DNA-3-methyladenine glycosylase II